MRDNIIGVYLKITSLMIYFEEANGGYSYGYGRKR